MKQETIEEAAERLYLDSIYAKQYFIKGAKWQQEQIGKSEFLQKLRATLSDAEARRLIFLNLKINNMNLYDQFTATERALLLLNKYPLDYLKQVVNGNIESSRKSNETEILNYWNEVANEMKRLIKQHLEKL